MKYHTIERGDWFQAYWDHYPTGWEGECFIRLGRLAWSVSLSLLGPAFRIEWRRP